MRALLLIFALVFSVFFSPSIHSKIEDPIFFKAQVKKVPVSYTEIIEDGEEIRLYVEGYLPNSCYGPPRAEVAMGKAEIRVDVFSNVSGEACAQVIRLFDLEVNLGELEPGYHVVVVQKGTRWERRERFTAD